MYTAATDAQATTTTTITITASIFLLNLPVFVSEVIFFPFYLPFQRYVYKNISDLNG
jgi:hypothetical protein